MQHIASRLPASIDMVIGVPRSGMLAGTMLALQLNINLTDVSGYINGRVLGSGRRPVHQRHNAAQSNPRAVLVDDSAFGGAQIVKTKQYLADAGLLAHMIVAVPYVTSRSKHLVDIYTEVVESPRAFAWNILHHPGVLDRACVDIDGVLCRDPLVDDNDDGPRYERFLRNACPLFLPACPVMAVVTSRLERYRSQTEAWLARHNVKYNHLVMLNSVDAATRRATGMHATFKAAVYRELNAELFIESDYRQALEIANLSGRQVFAVDQRQMVYPSPRAAIRNAPLSLMRSASHIPPAQALYWHARRRAVQIVRRAQH